MAKGLRKQLAESHQHARDLANKIDQVEHPLRVKIASLEKEKATLQRQLAESRTETAMLSSRVAAIRKLTEIADIITMPIPAMATRGWGDA